MNVLSKLNPKEGMKVMEKKPKKVEKKPKKRQFNPDVIPVQAKVYAPLHRTLSGNRKF